MINVLLDRLRGARRIELFAALAIMALLALLLLGRVSPDSGGKTELEARMERILSDIDGTGSVSVMITEDSGGQVTGALIVASALEDVQTCLNLQSAVSKLLGIDADRIEIIGRDGQFGGAI